MKAAGRVLRTGRAEETRELILITAERLFAEHGITAVSNRQISEAAGQGNNTAVGYHFGTKADLVHAVIRKHNTQIETRRRERLIEFSGSTDVRDRVACLVRPLTDHLAALGNPTWHARFAAQVMTEPTLRAIVLDDARSVPTIRATIEQLNACLPPRTAQVRTERGVMARTLLMHTCAEHERALATRTSGRLRASWHDTGTGLIDAIVGLLLAPVTPTPGPPPSRPHP